MVLYRKPSCFGHCRIDCIWNVRNRNIIHHNSEANLAKSTNARSRQSRRLAMDVHSTSQPSRSPKTTITPHDHDQLTHPKIEGLFTILASFIFAALFPGIPRNPITLLKLSYFNERERSILVKRVIIDDPSKGQKKRAVTKEQLFTTVSHYSIFQLHIIPNPSLPFNLLERNKNKYQ